MGSCPGRRSSSLSVFVVRDFDKHGLGVAPRGLQVSLRGSITIFYYARRLCNNCGKEASSAKRFGAEFCFIVFFILFHQHRLNQEAVSAMTVLLKMHSK